MREIEDNENLVDRVYEHVSALLADQGLMRSMSLNVVALAERLGVSRTPVRLALERLQALGLAQYHPSNGWSSVPIKLGDLEEILELKKALEIVTACRAAERITPTAGAALMGVVEDMEAATRQKAIRRWLEADSRYHDIMRGLAGNGRLRRMIGWLDNQWYRTRLGHIALEGRMAIASQEHRRIAEAVAAGDVVAAGRALADHSDALRESLMNVLNTVVIPFLGPEL